MANPYIANGTCYSAAGRQANPVFAPCGNDLLGHRACCQLGDQCLSSNACYNGAFGTTYLGGCSDPEYQDATCPDKTPYPAQAWTGLVYCNGTSNEWIACRQADSPPTLETPDACWCPDPESRTVAFTADSTLAYVASMPSDVGGSIVFQAGYVPTQAPTTVTAKGGADSGAGPTITGPSGQNAPTAPPPSPDSTPSSSLSSSSPPSSSSSGGATAGIAVGVTVGCLLLIGVFAFLFLMHRRRLRRRDAGPGGPAAAAGRPRPDLEGSPHPSELPDTDHKRMQGQPSPLSPKSDGGLSLPSELGSMAARPWSLRSELPADEKEPGVGGGGSGREAKENQALLRIPVAELPG